MSVRLYRRAQDLAERARREAVPISTLVEELVERAWDQLDDTDFPTVAPEPAPIARARVFAPPRRR